MSADTWIPNSYESYRVLNAIREGVPVDDSTLPSKYRNHLARIADEYGNETKRLGNSYAPRNLPFYNIIRRRYPQFRWLEVGQQTHVETYHRGRKPSLLAYLLELIPSSELASTARISMAQGTDSINDREHYLPAIASLGACRPSTEDCARLDRWLSRSRQDGVATIISPVCPDYSAEAGEERTYRFTFAGVGSGCGLAGLRLLESIEGLHKLFQTMTGASTLTHHVCVGDFEAFSPDNLATVGLTEDLFLENNRRTADALAAASPVPIVASLFTDHCGGRNGWMQRYEGMLARFEAGEFGILCESALVRTAAEARRGLYERWHGVAATASSDFLRSIVIRQGAEYATMGAVIAERFANPLIIGADHQRMAPFYQFVADLPVLYLDRNYD